MTPATRQTLCECIEGRIGEFIQQRISLAIEHLVALLNNGLTDGLGQVTLAGTGWTKEQAVFAASNKVRGGQVKHLAAIHLLVEAEVKVVERPMPIAKAGLLRRRSSSR